jgi:hypothetical protein
MLSLRTFEQLVKKFDPKNASRVTTAVVTAAMFWKACESPDKQVARTDNRNLGAPLNK